MKILYLTPRLPYPIDKGDKLRAFYQIKYLSKNHDIFLLSLDETLTDKLNDNPVKNFCKKIIVFPLTRYKIFFNLFRKIFSSVPFQTAFYYNPRIKKEILKAINDIRPDIIFCQLIRAAEYVIEIKNIPKIIDYVDIISKGLERRASKSNLLMKFLIKIEFNRVRNYEKKVFKEFDNSIIISGEDRNFLPFEEKENVKIVPNGIDLEYFYPMESEKEYDLFFSGNLNYPPNVDASIYIVKNILPLLLKRKPDIKILIAGASPNKKILSLVSRNVIVKGWVDDIREFYKKAKIFIAPMQLGTGLQNKLLQAMAMKIPCVTSELTMKGLAEGAEKVLLVAKKPLDYSELVIKLLEDDNYRNSIAQRGYEFVQINYRWEKIIENLEEIIQTTINKK